MLRKTPFVHKGISATLPQVHEIVRLTHPDRPTTLSDCVSYRLQPAGGVSLTWLRDSAFALLSGQVTENALVRAAREKLPARALPSVVDGISLLSKFVRTRDWRGARIPSVEIEIGRGLKVPLEVVGLFDEGGQRWVVALQPRLHYHPSPWQMEVWLALLQTAFCSDPLRPAKPMIVDISHDKEKGRRALHVLTPDTLALLSKAETDFRLDVFTSAYLESVEIVPVRPKRKDAPKKMDETEPELPF